MSIQELSIYEKLAFIQQNLNVPKNQFNKFGNYKYRSLEDIQKAVKPLLNETKTMLLITDKVKLVGDRIYVESTARLRGFGEGEGIIATAYAREALSKKGMSEDQITGSASSYARKYCLNGLFCIDDTKDADAQKPEQKQPQGIGKENLSWLTKFCKDHEIKTDKDKKDLQKHYGFAVATTTPKQFLTIKAKIKKESEVPE